MSVRIPQPNLQGGIYFITFTCYGWKPLFQITSAYDAVYKWFDYMRAKGAAIVGYVIMTNHLHVLLYLPAAAGTVNTIVSNAKRFLAYKIIKRLEAQAAEPLLQHLHGAITKRQSKKGQLHRVFEESFDAKLCYSPQFIQQKLDYMHHNPVRGKWDLVDDFALYAHSSAGFYYTTDANIYKKIVRVEELAM